MFRDESVRVQQKHRLASQKYKDAASKAGEGSSSSEYESSPDPEATERELRIIAGTHNPRRPIWTLERPTERPMPMLSQSLSDVAMAFFLTDYCSGSHFDYLPLLYSHSPVQSPLTNILQAVSIVSLSHETRNPDLMALARQRYSHSLIDANQALRDPVACRQDTTLAAVLLLAQFETLAIEDTKGVPGGSTTPHDSEDSPSAGWDRHLDGAVSLLAYRPKPTLDNPVEFRLYQHVNAMARYSAVQHRTRVSTELAAWDLPFGTKRDHTDPNRRFMVVIDDFTELRASIQEGSLNDPLEIIQLAKSIDADVALTARSFPPSWSYDVITTSRDTNPGIYKCKYHLYPNHRAAQLWNEVRMTRLAIQEMLLIYSEQARQLNDTEGDEILLSLRARCVRVVNQMATEICQSTTQFLCLLSRSSPSQSDDSTSPSSLKSAASAYVLIWPLFMAAAASRVGPKSLLEFAVDRLRFIECEMKIPQAGRAASMLEAGVMHEDWLHMLHLF
ncbi:hypothetical protein H2200_003503 [Cladophialophora chaetospira]|uniref:C6 transcription factor n=1 Tax=Cladophialophora chaetospira TaxID=386627 RepID=A0AA38XI65_9EURO|nr:hypothetical protein H2200_003503 [Cladophialophora chaetospira]